MELVILAVGRLRGGPEQDLIDTYAKRLAPRVAGLGPLRVIEVEAKKGLSGPALQAEEARLLQDAIPDNAALVGLDERGKSLPSRDFARHVGTMRDDGKRALCCLIGGADGFHPDFRNQIKAQGGRLISFGAMTLPHMLVRAVLAEQLYRAATILDGHPYHRD